MARYKEYDYSQGKFIPIHFDKQIIPGTFEHTLHYLIDNEIDLSVFDLRYQNDETGAPAYDPARLSESAEADNTSEDHPLCLFKGDHIEPEDCQVL